MAPISSIWRRAAAGTTLLAAFVLLGAVWLAGTETALRWLAVHAAQASAGRLSLEDVRGSLYGRMRAGRFAFEDGDRRIEGRGLTLQWSPLELLLNRTVHIRSLELQALLVDFGKAAGEPAQFPQTLQLPLRLEIHSARIDNLTLVVNKERHEFRAFALKLENPQGRYRGTTTVETPWGTAAAELTLADTPPFALEGSVGLERGESDAYSAHAQLGGTLAAIGVAATASAKNARAELHAELAPFAPMPLKLAELRLAGVDARKFAAGLPRTDLGAELTLRAQGADAVAGKLKLANRSPGTLDASLVPLRSARLDFDGSPAALALNDIILDLGEAGRFAGKGSLRQGQLGLELSTPSFNLRGLYAKLAATKLAGKFALGLEGTTQTLRADLRQGAYGIRIDAAHLNDAVQIRSAKISVGGSELALNGAIDLGAQREFRAEGKLSRFDPSRLGDYPAASVSGSFSAAGQLSPRPSGTLQFSLADSRYRGHRLHGKGKAKISRERLWDSDIALELGANRLSLSGAFGAAGDALDWRAEAAKLNELTPQLAGQLSASGRLEGSMEEPSGTFHAKARNIAWAGKHRVAEFTAEGSIDKGIDGRLAFDAALRDYRAGALQIDLASIGAQGRRGEHELSVSARNAAIDMRAVLAGAWRAGDGWAGSILSFENRGPYAAALEAPASITVKGADFALGAASLRFARGTIRIDELTRRAGTYFSSGSLSGLDSAYLLGLTGQSPNVSSTLTLGGKWKLAAADSINGEFEIRREQGDVSVLSQPPTAVGLTKLVLSAIAVDNRVSAKLEAAGTVLGALSAGMQTTLAAEGVRASAPIAFDAEMAVPSLAWIAPLLGKHMVIDGRLQGKFSGQGSAARPAMSGSIAADGLKFEYPDQGIYLRDGKVRATLQENTLVFDTIALHGGAGTLEGKGSLAWDSGKANASVQLKADKFEVLRHLDRLLVLSGTAGAKMQDGDLQLTAALKADRGEFVLPEADAPTLSADVVVLGRNTGIEKKNAALAVGFDLGLDLGEQFRLRGKGLDTRLAGQINVRAAGGTQAKASGSIRVAQGSYSAYGQRLVIDRGVLNFIGPLDDPGLDIVALRKHQPVEAGVAIRGTALAPKISLVSNPSVPDSEKLSWLVLGHGMEDANRSEHAALQAAAGALLARGESVGLQSRIARAAGLDEFSLAGGSGLENTVVTVGKRVSSRAYLTVEQGIGASMSLVKISYALTPRLSVRTATGTESAVDAFYTFSFR